MKGITNSDVEKMEKPLMIELNDQRDNNDSQDFELRSMNGITNSNVEKMEKPLMIKLIGQRDDEDAVIKRIPYSRTQTMQKPFMIELNDQSDDEDDVFFDAPEDMFHDALEYQSGGSQALVQRTKCVPEK
ncbi:hypothetical protein O9G_004744 [Rozella allomycis CSF55]|uniref:Uncharacterized protein n=1 Tax=Rozella allomycis (strain CSF55) TaxID=988480 RepID=A0A075B4N1_ROZAC|nr:hypothetical protein O9G_004744 [Rozella allomycis CSF55]|eukprot:EPZ36317.1 hypothetical protein O9G_004744 [Rozella allomycis CSF55]